MGTNRFWIGGYTQGQGESVPWLVATSGGNPYLCCRCPCVKYYAILAFRVILLKGANHSDYDWCSQQAYANPVGIDQNNQVHLDDILYFERPAQGLTITISASAGLYEECGRTVIAITDFWAGEEHTTYYEVRAYFLSAQYPCYDEFRAECFGHCTDLPCDEWDEQTYECTHTYLPDYAKVFNGQKRPCYGNLSVYMSQYGCTSYWYNLAISRYVPDFNIEWGTKRLDVEIQQDAQDCLESETVTDDWTGETYERCLRWGTYAASLNLNPPNTTSYYTLIWDGTGTQPERTTSANVGWLSSALSSIIPVINSAKASQPSTWLYTAGSTSSSVLCSSGYASSSVWCNWGSGQVTTGKAWRWQCGTITLTKPSSAHQDATGVKLYIKTTVKEYDGTYTSGPDPEPVYTETVYTETRDVSWGVMEHLRTADGLSVSASAQACYSGTHSPACITPCDGAPYQQVEYEIKAIEYLFGSSSSSSSSSSGSSN